jgi:2-amino-4-hydroxy-6-hydroxymethyldihydropteridine diphosphokinase
VCVAYNRNMGIYLGLGSNVGDRMANLHTAMTNFMILRQSAYYETEPVDFLDQPWFLNAAIEIDTTLTPMELLQFCQELENRMGRQKEMPKGPRLIDIDLLFYDDVVLSNARLTLPHPAVPDRRFVLEPLNEIAAGYFHPVLKRTIAELLASCTDASSVQRI